MCTVTTVLNCCASILVELLAMIHIPVKISEFLLTLIKCNFLIVGTSSLMFNVLYNVILKRKANIYCLETNPFYSICETSNNIAVSL